MSAVLFLLRRYLFPRSRNLMALALWISVGGVALGIVQLMVVLSVMSGFQNFLKNAYTRITSELVVIPKHPSDSAPDFRLSVTGSPGVAAITPFALGAGMVMKSGVGGAILEGIDLESSRQVTPWEEVWQEAPNWEEQKKTPHWIWLGTQLAKKLKAQSGDTVNILIADGAAKKIVPFKVTGITKFGIYDHDLRYARVDLPALNDLFKRTTLEPMYKVKVKPSASIEGTAEGLKTRLGSGASIKAWHELNQNVFLAVQHQKHLLFLVLEIIVALAAMNVVNLLMMSTHQRKRDIAILRAMGMRFRGVCLFFVAQGTAVGIAGILGGIVLGVGACRLVERFQPSILSEAVYNVTRLPIKVEVWDVTLIAVAAFFLCVVFSLVPALRAALSRPVEALRYE